MRRIAKLLALLLLVVIGGIVLPPLWYSVFPQPVPELPPAGRRVAVAPGTSVNVIDEGHGQPIVLVHGHPGSAYDWAPLQHALAARGYRVLAYDRVGYGRSDPRRNGDYTVAANANELLALLAEENLDNVIVAGWSYGGGTAIGAARADASRIAGLVLLGSVGPGVENREAPPEWLLEFIRGPGLTWVASVPPLERRLRAALTANAFSPAAVSPDYLALLDANFGRPHTLDTFRSEGRDLDGRADVDPQPLDLPILVIHGDGDLLVPRSVGEELHRRAQHGDLWVVENGRHMLPITHTQEVADRITAFARGGDTAP